MSTIPKQSSFVTDDQAYTVDCAFCSAKAGELCINVRSLTDSTRQPQYYTCGVHKARIKAYKALHQVQDIEQPTPASINKAEAIVDPTSVKNAKPTDVIYVPIDGLNEPLPVKVETIEIYAVVHSTKKAILVESLHQYTAWIPKTVIIASERNKLFIRSNFDIHWTKTVTQ